jgi:hypothetical protein
MKSEEEGEEESEFNELRTRELFEVSFAHRQPDNIRLRGLVISE